MQSKMKKMRNNEIHTFCFFKPRIYFESKPVWHDSNSKVSKPLPPKLDEYFVVERRSGGDDIADHRASDRRWS